MSPGWNIATVQVCAAASKHAPVDVARLSARPRTGIPGVTGASTHLVFPRALV